MVSLSIVLATTLRPTLGRAVLSAVLQMTPDDELIVVSDSPDSIEMFGSARVQRLYCRRGGDWGNLERNVGMQYARGSHLMFLDDDDRFLSGGLEAVRNALTVHPDNPHMFRMVNEVGHILWKTREVRRGNHGTPCFVTPNNYKKLGSWPRSLYEGDFAFCDETLSKYPHDSLIWSEAVIYGCRDWSMGPVEIG